MYMYSLCEMMLDGAMSKLLILMLNLYLVTVSGNRFYCVRTKSSSNLTITNTYCIINASFIRLSDKYYSCIFIKTPNVYVPLGDCVESGFFFYCLFVRLTWPKKSNPNHTCTYTFIAQASDNTIRV